MKYTKQLNLCSFALFQKSNSVKFTYNELKELEYIIEDFFHEKPATETDINDLFWFEEELLCDCLALNFDEYENR